MEELYDLTIERIVAKYDGVINCNTIIVTADETDIAIIVRNKPTVGYFDPEKEHILKGILELTQREYRNKDIKKSLPGFTVGRDNLEIVELVLSEFVSSLT